MTLNQTPVSIEDRLEWIEPELHQLDVRETAMHPHSGSDGGAKYSDCTKS